LVAAARRVAGAFAVLGAGVGLNAAAAAGSITIGRFPVKARMVVVVLLLLLLGMPRATIFQLWCALGSVNQQKQQAVQQQQGLIAMLQHRESFRKIRSSADLLLLMLLLAKAAATTVESEAHGAAGEVAGRNGSLVIVPTRIEKQVQRVRQQKVV
jgi:hypothetical protein